jgi:hypothetical protein
MEARCREAESVRHVGVTSYQRSDASQRRRGDRRGNEADDAIRNRHGDLLKPLVFFAEGATHASNALRVSQPVAPATAQDPGSYSIKVWNYRYAQQYGSKDWLVSQPDKEGREDWIVKSATVQPDAHSVRLEIPGIRAVMQGELKYNVDTRAGGKPLRGSLWFTLNQVR